MKKNVFLASFATMVLASCTSEVLQDAPTTGQYQKAITFENTLTSNSTRAGKSEFGDGDAMGIYGFQYLSTSTPTKVFNNQQVIRNGAKWTYSPLKYWNDGSVYEFYGIYPYNVPAAKACVFDEVNKLYSITDFDATSGTDVMIAEVNHARPYSTVNMNFNHLLSNVYFHTRLADELGTSGISNIKVVELEVTGLKSIGTFQQSGFNSTSANVEGSWSDLNGAFTFAKSTPTDVALSTSRSNICDNIVMPQPLCATLRVKYTINYTDGSATTFEKIIPLESIKANGTPITKWEMNTVYNYVMILNPSKHQQITFDPNSIDWDGSIGDSDGDGNGDLDATPGSKLVGPDDDGNYWVEVDNGDGTSTTYPVVWEDIDGDGKLEGGVDRDGDGHIDNVDGDNTNDSDASERGHENVSDGTTTTGNEGKDVILVDTNNDGKPDAQLERDPSTKVGPENPTDAPVDTDPDNKTGKKFTIDWNGSKDANGNDSTNPADESTPVNYSRLVLGEDGEYYVEVDVDQDGVYNGTGDTRTKVEWADIDGDGKLEGYIGNVDGDNTNNSTNTLVADGKTTTGGTDLNPNGYDVILIDTNNDGVCDTQLEKICNGTVYPSDALETVITFDASIEGWSTTVTPEIPITQ